MSAFLPVLVFCLSFAYGEWTDPVQVAPGYTNQTCTWNIAVPGSDTLDVVYYDDNNVIRYKQSTDNGVTWSAPDTLSVWAGWGKQRAPTIVVDRLGGRHAVWYWWWDASHEDSSFVYYNRDLGSGWEGPVVIVRQGRVYAQPSIVVDESLFVHVAYANNAPQICYLRSTDRGTTWEPSRQVSTSGGFNIQTKIATDFAGTVHAIWSRFCDQSYRRSTDRGVTWEPEIHLTSGNSGIQSSIACDRAGHVYATYTDHVGAYCCRSTDSGASWESAVTLITATYPNQTAVACGPAGGVYVFSHAKYCASKDHGVTWSEPVNVAGQYASVAVSPDGRYQHVVWYSSPNVMHRRNEYAGRVAEPAASGNPALLQSRPDPFSARTTVRYSIRRSGRVVLKVHDVLGNEVRTLVNRWQDSGTRQVVWDGTDNSGCRVAGGVYCCRLVAGGEVSVRRLLVAR